MTARRKGGVRTPPDPRSLVLTADLANMPLFVIESHAPTAAEVVKVILDSHVQGRSSMIEPDAAHVDEIRRQIALRRSVLNDVVTAFDGIAATLRRSIEMATPIKAELSDLSSRMRSLMLLAARAQESGDDPQDRPVIDAARTVLDAPDALRRLADAIGVLVNTAEADADHVDRETCQWRDIARAAVPAVEAACRSAGAPGVSFLGNDSPAFRVLHWVISTAIAPAEITRGRLFDVLRHDKPFSVKLSRKKRK